MEELITALFFAFWGSMLFLFYRSIKNKTGGWLLANQKTGAIIGMIGSVILILLLLVRACNKLL